MAQTTIQGSFLGDGTVTGVKIGADFISAQTVLSSGLATADELIVSDGGVIKKMAISVLEIAATQITASGTLPALNGSNLTALAAANITASGTLPALVGTALTALNADNIGSGTVPVARLGDGNESNSTFLRGDNTWVAVTSSDTTYTTSWVDSSANAILRLTAGGSGSGNDDLTIVAGSNITLTPSGDNLTIAAAGGGGTDVSARVFHTSNQSIANNSTTVLAFNNESDGTSGGYDTHSFHDNSTNNSRLTIPSGQGGKYIVWATIRWDTHTTGLRSISIKPSDSGSEILSRTNAVGTDFQTIMAIINLEAGEYVQIQVYQNSGGSLDIVTSSNQGPLFGVTKVLG